MDLLAINKALDESCSAVSSWLNEQEDEKFSMGPAGKWDTSQHIDHLIRTSKAIIKGLKIPKFLIKYRFGTPNRVSRDYSTVVERYQLKLRNIPPGMVAPLGVSKHQVLDKQKVMDEFNSINQKLIKQINKWNNKQLDGYLLPHPLMGRMTIRELLMWCSYHHYHHLKTLKEYY